MIQPEEVTILKNSIAKGASDEELKFCLTVARRYKLDPFKKEIWFIKRWDKNAENLSGGTGAYVWHPQVGIYGKMHLAARDHVDYGTISATEYGPTTTIVRDGKHIIGPEWARVKVWKKGMSQPTIGEAFFEEYCPKNYDNTLFWRTMPHRMISKCAKSQGISEAYPDLGGLKIPEEMERMDENYTREGRQIIEKAGLDVPQMGTHAAGQAVGQAKIAELKEKMAKPIEAVMDAPSDIPKANRPDPLPEVLPPLPEHDDIDDIWPKRPEPSTSSPAKETPTSNAQPGSTAAKGRGGSGSTPAAEIIKGTIQHFTEKMTKGREADPDKGIKAKASQPFLSVLLKTESGDRWYSLFDRDLIPFISKGKGKEGEFFVQNNGKFWNMVGIKRIGGQEFEENLPVIQQKTREAGSKSLYD
jgi:hypothetical protein